MEVGRCCGAGEGTRRGFVATSLAFLPRPSSSQISSVRTSSRSLSPYTSTHAIPAVNDPQIQIRDVIRGITEPRPSAEILANVDRYFSTDAVIIHPMLNSPAKAGREGLKAAYKMLRVLTINNKITFHTVAFDKVVSKKGIQHQTALIDLTENLQLRFLPLPTSVNPTLHPRFIVRVDLRKDERDNLWYITRQEDNIPTDLGASGLVSYPLAQASDAIKWALGVGTLAVGGSLSYFGLLG